MTSTTSSGSLTITPKDIAAIQQVFDEGISLKKELSVIKKLQPKKREELQKRAKRFYKLLKENEKILANMFGDVKEDEEAVTVVDGLLEELREIYSRLGLEVRLAA